MKALAALALLPALAGCAIVSVRTDEGPARITVYPLGVRIERGDARAASTSFRTIGAWSGPAGAGIGLASASVDLIDVTACSAALVHTRAPDPNIIGRLAGETRAVCPKPQGEP